MNSCGLYRHQWYVQWHGNKTISSVEYYIYWDFVFNEITESSFEGLPFEMRCLYNLYWTAALILTEVQNPNIFWHEHTVTTYFPTYAWHISYHWLFVVESHSTSALNDWCPAAICTAACLSCAAPTFSAIWLDATEVVAIGGGIWGVVFPLDSTSRHFSS